MSFTIAALLHCWKSAPNPTEYHKSSTKFACGGQFNILSSKLNGSHSCYIAGKVLQIANPTEYRKSLKNSPAAGSSVYFHQN